ncbi:NYN domain-containing protein [Nocardioides panacis]|uniref:NYN domain-containing protein n=2 Tax=Nocardioides panacis TaxID=2849501 RepID=A0A975T2T1_9ACTN|nr:NYN domain-containing protein [Nocardioides panacis]
MPADQVPSSLTRVAAFAPARRARLAATQIASVLATDEGFREHVAADVRAQVPDLAGALDAGTPPSAADPVDLAAVAYLLRPDGWAGLVAASGEASLAEDTGAADRQAARRADQLRRQVETLTESLKEARARQRDQVAELKSENADLRHKLGDARARARSAETASAAAEAAAVAARAAAAAASARHDADLRRVRARVEELERDLAAVRRSERAERGSEALRARLLLDTLLETAQGLRRELALPPVEGSPADSVEAHVAEHGTRTTSGHGSLASDDPVLLEQLLTLPRVHLVVDGYNVTKAAWPELSLERQRDRLLAGVAPLVARSGAEVTVVFDAADSTDRPVVNRPRGVRVLYSRAGVIADDVIRELVAAEPKGRPVVVVSSDNAVVRDVVRAGARAAAAGALTRLLARS